MANWEFETDFDTLCRAVERNLPHFSAKPAPPRSTFERRSEWLIADPDAGRLGSVIVHQVRPGQCLLSIVAAADVTATDAINYAARRKPEIQQLLDAVDKPDMPPADEKTRGLIAFGLVGVDDLIRTPPGDNAPRGRWAMRAEVFNAVKDELANQQSAWRQSLIMERSNLWDAAATLLIARLAASPIWQKVELPIAGGMAASALIERATAALPKFRAEISQPFLAHAKAEWGEYAGLRDWETVGIHSFSIRPAGPLSWQRHDIMARVDAADDAADLTIGHIEATAAGGARLLVYDIWGELAGRLQAFLAPVLASQREDRAAAKSGSLATIVPGRKISAKKKMRAETFKKIKDGNIELSYAGVAMKAQAQGYPNATEDTVRNDYRDMGWKWEPSNAIR